MFDNEHSALKGALKDTVGPEKSRDSRHFSGDMHVVSYGAAFQAAEDGVSSASAMFDAARGRGVLADGNGSMLAARSIARGFLRALGRNKPEQLITSYDATEAVRKAAMNADVVLGKTKAALGESYSDLAASFSGFQLLYQGRMAISHSGDTSVFVFDPDGLCRQATHRNDNQLAGAASRRGAQAAGSYGQNTVVDLKPGRNVVIIASNAAVADRTAWGVGDLVGELKLDPDNPDNGAIIAAHIMDNGDKG
ncbi:MAG TPA: hypothetical protein VFT58_05435, partial [Nitrososphaera sp.]|nr:hypothetical protein [Nitrososphaera sp.]